MSRHFPDFISAFEDYTSNTEAPDSYRRWVGISLVASALQRKCQFTWDEVHYPNMYIVLVGPSGVRKGSAMRPGKAILREAKVKLSSEAITREALIQELFQSEDLSGVAQGIKPHSSLTIYSSELTVFLGYNNVQLIMDLTDWYDCEDQWKYTLKTKPSNDIQGVWVNLLGATTPQQLRQSLPEDAIGGGLSSRTIFVFEEHKGKDVVFPFLEAKDHAFTQRLIEDISDIGTMNGEFKFTPEFLEAYGIWHKTGKRKDFLGTFLEAYEARRPIHHLKLSTIVCASRTADMVVTKSDFLTAVKYLKAIEDKMKFTFSGMGANPQAQILAKIIGTLTSRKEITFGELVKLYQYEAKVNDLYEMLNALRLTGNVILGESKDGNFKITYIEEE